MKTVDRRKFLALLGAPAVAAALPLHLEKALAIPAHNRTGTIDDVEHIIFLMQENRSFDHYFGTLRGVRGFADPHPVTLPSGKSVWHQPNGAGELLPFRPEVATSARTCRTAGCPRCHGSVAIQGDSQFEYHYAGHLENGEASISDPGMGGLI